ncbi:hypothetical protein GCM10010420_21230 [Streptomyces glaucosporus]|uniref:Uncharacterized protein n=1 Tax=Streptomyces glaucosporus TaxID=284044 RepID=A0ABP5V997_9ACTN
MSVPRPVAPRASFFPDGEPPPADGGDPAGAAGYGTVVGDQRERQVVLPMTSAMPSASPEATTSAVFLRRRDSRRRQVRNMGENVGTPAHGSLSGS